MLSFQQPAKRRRDDDDSDSEDEPYMKKARSWLSQTNEPFQQHKLPSPSHLAFRPSFNATPPEEIDLPQLSAIPSEHSDNDNGSPATLADDYQTDDVDMDDSDDFDIIGSQPPDSPLVQSIPHITGVMRPPKLNANLFSEPASNTGRIPTPIHGNFYAPRGPVTRGNNFLQPPDTPTLQPPVVRKQAPTDRTTRMPSPICEDEDIPDTPTALTQSQLSRLSVNNNHNMDVDERSFQKMETITDEEVENMPPPPTPMRKGRSRSGALSSAKGRFSMGYREDCDKCRARIPGHYSHFLPA